MISLHLSPAATTETDVALSSFTSDSDLPMLADPLEWNSKSRPLENLSFFVSSTPPLPTFCLVVQPLKRISVVKFSDRSDAILPLDLISFSHSISQGPRTNSPTSPWPLVVAGLASEIVWPAMLAVNSPKNGFSFSFTTANDGAAKTASTQAAAASPIVILRLLILLSPRFRLP